MIGQLAPVRSKQPHLYPHEDLSSFIVLPETPSNPKICQNFWWLDCGMDLSLRLQPLYEREPVTLIAFITESTVVSLSYLDAHFIS